MKKLIAFAAVFAVLSVTVSCYAKNTENNAHCLLCGVDYDPRIQYHGDCVNDPKWRGVFKALAKTKISKPVTDADSLKRIQQLDAAYRAKFPGQPEESYPKFTKRGV